MSFVGMFAIGGGGKPGIFINKSDRPKGMGVWQRVLPGPLCRNGLDMQDEQQKHDAGKELLHRVSECHKNAFMNGKSILSSGKKH